MKQQWDGVAIGVLALVTLTACGGSDAKRAADLARAPAAAEEARAQARALAAEAIETERLAALWTYQDLVVAKGRQISATINSSRDVETDGGIGHRVLLVFRDHASWGRSAYLVLQSGDFRCAGGCRIQVTADDGAPVSMAARRADTNEAIALLITDARALWRMTTAAKTLALQFPVKTGGTRTATYDVGGLDRSKMPPAWSAPSPAVARRVHQGGSVL